jgi:extracellular elastinolytic metalloproteinase
VEEAHERRFSGRWLASVAALVAGSLLALPAIAPAETLQAVDEALSRPAAGDRADVALDWVRANRSRLGLTADAVDELEPALRTTSRATGFTHLRFRQADRGIPAFDGGVRVSLDRSGRILSAAGAPAPQIDSAVPRLDAVEAVRALGVTGPVRVTAGPAGVRRTTEFEDGDVARLVLFGSGRGARLAWHLTYGVSDAVHHDAVVDATTGAVLFRQNLVKHDVPADVFLSHPTPGPMVEADFEPWLDLSQLALKGPNAHVYSDVNDNDSPALSEEIQRRALPDDDFKYPLTFAGCPDGSEVQCTWTGAANSWRANREQNGVQAFYLVNRFHDHLANDPQIQFAGFEGVDAVQVETDDGAETGPNPAHVNNANMLTLPEGREPTMQLYLFKTPFRTVNGGDSAAIVWHEYTHGLSNRLVVHDDGSGALSSAQAGAMGEGWSDWYAMDLLVGDNLMADTAAPGEVDVGHYVDKTPHTVRSQPIDCSVGAAVAECPGGGGYTYADFGQIAGFPEVHFDGEIWAQTLWDLRDAIGPDDAQKLITEGMRMAPPEPSFLDMRNAILAADTGLGGADRTAIWQVFAARGMGYRAYSDGANDITPTADFSTPPAPGGPLGTIAGTVTSSETGKPLENVTVGLASLVGEAGFADQLATQTVSNGTYTLDAPAGTYGELSVERPGYVPVAVPDFTVTAGATRVQDVALRRDWAASAGGAVVLTAGFDNSGAPFGCGLARLIDQRLESGWSAIKPSSGSAAAVVVLPEPIQVTGFGLDPANTCGNGFGASTAGYRVETSSDGVSFSIAAQGTFGSADRGRLNSVPASASNVRYVRVRLLSSLGAGSQFIDLSELVVFGAPPVSSPNPPPNQLPTGSLAASRTQLTVGGIVEFAASFTDDSRIVGYDWDFDGDGVADRSTAESTTSFVYTRSGAFNATVAVRDDSGGSGTATRAITVTPLPRPVVKLPQRGQGGAVTARVTCAERCTLTARMRVDGRVVRTVRRTLTTTSQRRVELALTRKARRAYLRRHRRSVRARVTVAARYGDGRSTTARRTIRVTL